MRKNFGVTLIFKSEKQMAKKAKKRKYSKGAAKKVKRAMTKRKAGTLKSAQARR